MVGHAVPQSVAIIAAGSAKMFVGEVVELGLAVMDERKETGPLRPEHLQEAWRRYRKMYAFKSRLYRNSMFL